MAHYRVYNNKIEVFEDICKRDNLQYDIIEIGRNLNFKEVSMEISRSRFRELLDDVDCEIQRSNSKHPEIPVISFRTMLKPKKFNKIVSEYPVFRTLSRDKTKFANI